MTSSIKTKKDLHDSTGSSLRPVGGAAALPKTVVPVLSFLTLVLAVATSACGARTALEDASNGSADVGDSRAALWVGVGAYSGCALETLQVSRALVASGGGSGSVTLTVDDAGHIAARLSFDRWLGGNATLVPTSSTTAASPKGVIALSTVAADFTTPARVLVTAASLVTAGDQLFISLLGRGATSFHGFLRCPIPAGLPPTALTVVVPSAPKIPTGTYAHCVTTNGGYVTSVTTGGDLSLALVETGGERTLTEVDGYPDVCALAFDDRAATTSSLTAGRTCEIAQPCGPPPTLGPSTAPSKTTLGHMAGAMQLVDGALFVDVVGDAPAEACGAHFISLICPTAP